MTGAGRERPRSLRRWHCARGFEQGSDRRGRCPARPDTLRRAERDGLVMRHVDAGRVETAALYRLTDLGRSLDGPLAALDRWTASYWHEVEAARQHWNQRSE